MKTNRLFTGIVLLFLQSWTGFPAQAQSEEKIIPDQWHRYDTDAELRADLTKAGGEYDMYDFNLPELTAAPKGYRPVYISHFGRHGSRYALGDEIYEDLLDILRKGAKKGILTGKGKDLLIRYEKIYPKVAHRGGELTFKGQTQHRLIAQKMYEDFPEVFKGETHAEAISTHSQRVIMSMAAFINELDELDKDFTFTMDEGLVYYPVLHPNSSHNPWVIRSKGKSEEAKMVARQFQEEKLDLNAFGAKFFTDTKFLDKEYGLYKFMLDVRTFVVDLPSLDFEPEDRFEDLITEEELINFWEVWNFNGYTTMGLSPLSDKKNCRNFGPVLRNIFEQAEQDLENEEIQLRLRFTHDVAILPLLSFMGINSFGAEVFSPEEVKNYWRCFDVPMASNIQFIFYLHKKNKEVLVKILLNGRETSLPINEYCPGFYSWKEMKSFYSPLMDQADEFLNDYK